MAPSSILSAGPFVFCVRFRVTPRQPCLAHAPRLPGPALACRRGRLRTYSVGSAASAICTHSGAECRGKTGYNTRWGNRKAAAAGARHGLGQPWSSEPRAKPAASMEVHKGHSAAWLLLRTGRAHAPGALAGKVLSHGALPGALLTSPCMTEARNASSSSSSVSPPEL